MKNVKIDGADKTNRYQESTVQHDWVEILFYWQWAHKGPAEASLLFGSNLNLLMILQLSCGLWPKKKNIFYCSFPGFITG